MKGTRISLADLQAQMKSQAPSGWDNKTAKFPLAFLEKTPRVPRKTGVRNKTEEHDDQTAVVTYLKKLCPQVLVSSSLNGELRPTGNMGQFYGWLNKLKAKGMLNGDCDLRLTWGPQRCIFIEMKKKKGGVVSDAQSTVGQILMKQGFAVYVLSTGVDGLKEIIRKENIPCIEHV